MDDAELAGLAAAGDRSAWSAIYDRYADRLHDYCWSILRDRHEAEDALHDAFVTAATKIDQLRDPALLRPWLYAICRSQALAKVRRRKREAPSEDVADMTPAVTDRSDSEIEELRRLVWDAAGGLAPRDRSVLELHLRHGLEGQELAAALGTNPHHATVLLSRVREHVERSLGALLVGRTGRRNCAELDGLLAGWDGALSPLLRKRVARHIDGCTTCGERRRRMVSPLALLSGVPLLPAPEYLRAKVLADVQLAASGGPLGASTEPGDDLGSGAAGQPSGAGTPARRSAVRRAVGDGRVAVLVGAAALTLLALVGAAFVSVGRADDPAELAAAGSATQVAAPGQRSRSGTAVAEPTAEPTAGAADSTGPGPVAGAPAGGTTAGGRPAPAAVELLTRSIDLGEAGTQAPLRFRNTGGQPLAWSITSDHPAVTVAPASGTLQPATDLAVTVRLERGGLPEGDVVARLRLVAAGSTDVPVTAVHERPPMISDVAAVWPWLVPASTCESTRATAVVTDGSAVTVRLFWGRPGGLLTEEAMTGGSAGRYSASIRIDRTTPAGDIRWWVSATDERGNTARSAEQTLPVRAAGSACPR